jgi:multisubunit Na+/H+ antiporter MnhE subunit
MSFMTSFLVGVLVGVAAFWLMWQFGPQRRVWHALSLAAGFACGMTTPSAWNSLAAHFSFNFATGLLMFWGVFGLMSRSQWRRHA